ncbi:MAG: hypothetical protein R3B06_16590 [Kofleriaceae bacterium]
MRAAAVSGLLLLAVVAGATPPDLAARYQAGDLAEVRRRGRDVDVAELIAAATGADRAAASAATVALADHPDGLLALPALADVAAGWDRRRVADATARARQLVQGLDGDRAIHDDLDDELLARVATHWHAVAVAVDRWPDVRAAAVEIELAAVAARAATAGAPPALAAALTAHYASPEPEVRLAALERTPAPPPAEVMPALVATLTSDPEPTVRLVAAQALCAGDPVAGDAALGAAGRAALRDVIVLDLGRPGAVLDAARCVAADASPAARATLTALARTAPRVLRAPLAALARRPGP